jgi:hypothetical protein
MKALELYQRQLQNEASRKIAADPYAQPYFPRLSEEGLKKLVQRAVKDATPDGTSREQWADVWANRFGLAIEVLRARAAVADGEARRHAERASRSLDRLKGMQAREKRKTRDRRASLSPGARIDQALAGLSAVSMVPATKLEGDQVRGAERDMSPKWSGDQFGSARGRAVRLAEELEGLWDECRVRDLERAA